MEYKWFWEMIGADTKLLVATHLSGERTIEEAIKLFKQAKERSAKRPRRVVVDGGLMRKVSRFYSIRSIALT